MDRRRFIESAVGTAVATALAPAAMAGRFALGRGIGHAGAFSPSGSGYFPAGHWVAAKQAMILVYPRPDTETQTFACHRSYYADGTNGVYPDIPVGIAFGAFPLVFQKLSGPAWLNFGATVWQSGWVGSDAAAAKYGVLTVTDQAALAADTASYTVSFSVTDQAGASNTYSYSLSNTNGQYVFVSTTGSDSNAGTLAAPYATLLGAFGSVSTSTTNQGKICVVRAGTYTLPSCSDLTNEFRWDTSLKPASLISFPGETVSFTASSSHFVNNNIANDSFFGQFTCTGYDLTNPNVKLFAFNGVGTNCGRVTFNDVVWNNGGYGPAGGVYSVNVTTPPPGTLTDGTYTNISLTDDSSSGSGAVATIVVSGGTVSISGATITSMGTGYAPNDTLYIPQASIPGATGNGIITVVNIAGQDNACMVYTAGVGAGNVRNYFLMHNCQDNNRQSGTPGNNCALNVFFGVANYSVQYCSASGTAAIDSAFYDKGDVENGSQTGNFLNYTGGTAYAFSPFIQQNNAIGNCESRFNIGLNVGAIALPNNGSGTFGAFWDYRNSWIVSAALRSIQPNSGGPYVFENDAAQTSVALPTGTSVQTTGTIAQASGLLSSTTGKLLSSDPNYAANYGVIGAEIA